VLPLAPVADTSPSREQHVHVLCLLTDNLQKNRTTLTTRPESMTITFLPTLLSIKFSNHKNDNLTTF
jgi:hypothetical protein